ncbi:unnamed protein product [Trichogramma brassicae]|uniref:Odorant receptor n=1 Tax=Trichogramma brassicae TaxID=86971 RepID=A0A6H5J7G4_9HYME|nr:unnamed protein product [Trichogramma brassicae]
MFSLSMETYCRFKSIYAKIADHWSMIDDAEELEIVSKNMEQGYGVVKIYSLYCIIGMGCFLAMPITYPLLDYVIPMENKTRTMGEPLYVEYGLDPKKYYYPLMTQGFFGGLGCISVFVAFDVSYMMLTNYFKSIYTKIEDHWSLIDDAEELGIMFKNMKQGHRIVKIYSLYCIVGMGCFIAMPITYPLLDYVIPMENKTRTMGAPAYVEYGIDPEVYYYPLMAQGIFGNLACITL